MLWIGLFPSYSMNIIFHIIFLCDNKAKESMSSITNSTPDIQGVSQCVVVTTVCISCFLYFVQFTLSMKNKVLMWFSTFSQCIVKYIFLVCFFFQQYSFDVFNWCSIFDMTLINMKKCKHHWLIIITALHVVVFNINWWPMHLENQSQWLTRKMTLKVHLTKI